MRFYIILILAYQANIGLKRIAPDLCFHPEPCGYDKKEDPNKTSNPSVLFRREVLFRKVLVAVERLSGLFRRNGWALIQLTVCSERGFEMSYQSYKAFFLLF